MSEKLKPCGDCGMPVAAGEYHPFAACLMFKACGNSDTVRANLAAVRLDATAEFAKTMSELESASQPGGGWQPIETAPKDGTRILARNDSYGTRETYWCLYGDGSIAKQLFVQGKGPDGSWEWSEPQNFWASSWVPTHWMPLPDAPSAGNGGAD